MHYQFLTQWPSGNLHTLNEEAILSGKNTEAAISGLQSRVLPAITADIFQLPPIGQRLPKTPSWTPPKNPDSRLSISERHKDEIGWGGV